MEQHVRIQKVSSGGESKSFTFFFILSHYFDKQSGSSSTIHLNKTNSNVNNKKACAELFDENN